MATEVRPERQFTHVHDAMASPPMTTVMLRKLPRSTSNEAVRTMLLFAKDLQHTEIVPNEYPEDGQFATAVAHFSSLKGASEAQAMLDGKPNTAGQANMVVEIVSGSTSAPSRGIAIDPASSRMSTQSLSPPPQVPKASRFNGTFQSIEKISSPPMGSPAESNGGEGPAHMQSIFAPQSPINNGLHDRSRITGKLVIGEDGGDDETGELLKDPLAYMKNTNGSNSGSRYQTNLRLATSAFSAISLNTSVSSPSPSSYSASRPTMPQHPSHIAFSPGGNPYQGSSNHYLRHNYPPVNPADQNPPCNTLYVGNLPMDTSEDELKAMFSKQRGYKRLCFRTKQNGPMCFVEFEDVSFATKALNELYGASLHNSVKGGIRLSFSKNPLGVRSGQPGSTNAATPLGPGSSGMMSPMSPVGFSAVNGPPPGLSAPPGLNVQHSMSPNPPNIQYAGQTFGAAANPALPPNRSLQMGNGNSSNHNGGIYPDYMLGR